jgi:hypothetical protein
MEEKEIDGLFILFAKATPINKNDFPPSKNISYKDSTPSCRPCKDRCAGQCINLPNTFPREQA